MRPLPAGRGAPCSAGARGAGSVGVQGGRDARQQAHLQRPRLLGESPRLVQTLTCPSRPPLPETFHPSSWRGLPWARRPPRPGRAGQGRGARRQRAPWPAAQPQSGNLPAAPRAVDMGTAVLSQPLLRSCVLSLRYHCFSFKTLSPPTRPSCPPPGGEGRPSPHPGVVKVMVINPGALSLLFGVNWLAAFGLRGR